MLFLFFFVCGICCCCKARSAAKNANRTAPGESNVNNEIHGMVQPDYNSNNLNDGTGVEDYAFGEADTNRKVNQEET